MKVITISLAIVCTALWPAFSAQAAPTENPKAVTAKPKKQPPPAMTMEASERKLSPFEVAMQENSERFPTLTPNQVLGNINFHSTVILNEKPLIFKGERYDAFTFRTPKHNVGDLNWGFRNLSNIKGWYILPVEGTIEGFENYRPDESGTYQQLSAGKLKSESEYIIWFAFADDKPAKPNISLNLLNLDAAQLVGKTKDEVEKILGKPAPPEEFDSPDNWHYMNLEVRGMEILYLYFGGMEDRLTGIRASSKYTLKWEDGLNFFSIAPNTVTTVDKIKGHYKETWITKIPSFPTNWQGYSNSMNIEFFDSMSSSNRRMD